MIPLLDKQKEEFFTFLKKSQSQLTTKLEKIDCGKGAKIHAWERGTGGGGCMHLIRSQVVEKAGINVSKVWGDHYPAIEGDNKNKPFFATGLSTITHMYNPFAPIGHMNVRLIEVDGEYWFGGGADLTPFLPIEEDTVEFHSALAKACEKYGKDAYRRFKEWCDEYFYIKHRESIRGVGGVFFDYLKGKFDHHFNFIKAIAEAYIDVYPRILERRKSIEFTEAQKEGQLYWRGRYVEFNLVYDRGTKFGLLTGGNTDAIFASLPPVVQW